MTIRLAHFHIDPANKIATCQFQQEVKDSGVRPNVSVTVRIENFDDKTMGQIKADALAQSGDFLTAVAEFARGTITGPEISV